MQQTSSTENPNLPKVVIQLDHPGLPYRPGDLLKGSLQVSNVSRRGTAGDIWHSTNVRTDAKGTSNGEYTVANLEEIFVALRGRIIVSHFHKGMRRIEYSFSLVNVVHGVKLTPNGDWRFAVEIPCNTAPPPDRATLRASLLKRLGPKFPTQREHPLPPTIPFLIGLPVTSHTFAAIMYSLIPVRMKFRGQEKIFQMNSTKGAAPFWITRNYPSETIVNQVRNEDAHGVAKFTVKSKKLIKGLDIILKNTPEITCETTFSGPSLIERHGPSYPVNVGVKILEKTIPELTASSIPLSLISFSAALQRRCAEVGLPKMVQKKDLWRGRKDFAIRPVAFTGDLETYASQRTLLDLKVSILDKEFYPDFETYNFSVWYVIDIEVVFDYAGQKKKQHAEIPVKVFSRPRLETDEGETAGFVEGPQDVCEDWGALIDRDGVTPAMVFGVASTAAQIVHGGLTLAGVSVLAACTIL